MNRLLPSHDQKPRPCPEPQLELRWHTSARSHLAPRHSSFCTCQKVYLKGKWTSWHRPPEPGNVLHPSFLHQLSVVNFLSGIWNGLETEPQMLLLQSGLYDGCWCIFTPFLSWLMSSLWNPQIQMQSRGWELTTWCPTEALSLTTSLPLLPWTPLLSLYFCPPVSFLSKCLSFFHTISLTHRTFLVTETRWTTHGGSIYKPKGVDLKPRVSTW